MPEIGDVVDVVVEVQRPFGVFVDMGGEHNALIMVVHMYETNDRIDMPAVGAKVRAVVVGRRKDGQYALSLRGKEFGAFGREAEWRDWNDLVGERGSGGGG